MLELAVVDVQHDTAQMATQLAFLEFGEHIQDLIDQNGFSSDEARALARIGLASYFAGALLMPYGLFREAAEKLRTF